MPGAVAAGIVAVIPGISTTVATTIASVGLYAATTAASYFLQMAMQPEEKTGTKIQMSVGADVEQSFLIGKCITAGSLIYAGSWGPSNAYLTQVFDVSDISCSGAENEIFIDGLPYSIDWTNNHMDGGELVGSPADKKNSRDHNMVWVKHLDGTQTTADGFLRAKFGSAKKPWKTTMIGRGRSLMVVTTKYDKKEPASLPQFRFVMKGIKIYNFKKDSTNGGTGAHRYNDPSTWEYEDNPVNVIYHLSRGYYWYGEWAYGGRAWPQYMMDNDTFTSAVNKCNQDVTLKGGGTEKRYKAAGEIMMSAVPLDTLEELKIACNARLSEVGGIMHIDVGIATSPSFSITDNDVFVNDGRDGRIQKPFGDVVNTVIGTYTELKNGGNTKPLKPRSNATYITQDGGHPQPMATSMRLVTSNTQGQRLVKAQLREARRDLSRQIILGPYFKQIRPGMVISWDSDKYQYDSKDFIVGDVLLHTIGGVLVEVREVNPSDEDWDPVTDEDDFGTGVYDDEDLPVQIVPITVSAVTIKNNAGVDKKPAIKVEWDDDEELVDADRMRIQVKLLDSEDLVYNKIIDFDEFQTKISEGILRNEAYQVRAILVPYSPIRDTDWTSWIDVVTNDVGDDGGFTTDLPADLTTTPTGTLFTRIIKSGSVIQKLKIDLDVSGRPNGERYRIRVLDTTEDPDDLNVYVVDEFPKSIRVLTDHVYQIRVLPVSQSGIAGNPSALATGYTNPIPKKPGNPTVAAGLTSKRWPGGIRVKWAKNTDPDYKETALLRNTVNTPGTATEIARFAGNSYWDPDIVRNTQYFYWAVDYDTSDNPAASVSSVTSETYTAITYSDSDNVVLPAPSGVSLSQQPRDINNDGTVDIAVMGTFSGGVANAKDYAFTLERSANGSTGWTEVETKRSPTGRVWFGVTNQWFYRMSARAIAWDDTLGTPSGYTTPFQPGPTLGSPSDPSSVFPASTPLGYRCSWSMTKEADFAYCEVSLGDFSNPTALGIQATTTGTSIRFLYQAPSGSWYVWVRKVNTSGLVSNWVRGNVPQPSGRVPGIDIQDGAVGYDHLVAGAAGAQARTNLGTSLGGSVNAGPGTSTVLILTWKATSNTTGVTIDLGSKSRVYNFVADSLMTLVSWESGGGSFSSSKSGGGTLSGADLIAITVR